MSRRPAPVKTRRYEERMENEYESDYSDDSSSDMSDENEPRILPTHKGFKEPRNFNSRYHGRNSDFMSSTTYSSTNFSSSLDITEDTTESSSFSGAASQESQKSDLYARIQRRNPSPSRRGILMDEELSPVLHETGTSRHPHRLEIHKEWRPQHTSTTTDMQSVFAVPKTNPHMVGGPVCSTPRRRIVLTSYNQVLNMDRERPKSYHDIEMDPNLVWDNKRPSSTSTMTRSARDEKAGLCRPEHYGMHVTYAKKMDIKGILFLTMVKCGSMLSVTVNKAAYFVDRCDPNEYDSYVKVEIRTRCRKRQTSSANIKRYEYASASQKTPIVRSTNIPEFRCTLNFDINLRHQKHHQHLFVSVWTMSRDHPNPRHSARRMLGCMTFSINKMLESSAAFQRQYGTNDSTSEELLKDGGFYLLDEKRGQKTSFPQSKVNKCEYYNDVALSGGVGTSSFSSSEHTNGTSNIQMPMEELVTASRNFGSSMVPGYSTGGDHQRLHDESSASSSLYSREHYPYYHGMHRSTMPNIITTSDSSEHDLYSGASSLQNQDASYLYVDANQNDRKAHQRAGSPLQSPSTTKHVRRATSFTFSPKDSVDKYNKRPVQVKEKEDEKERRKLFGPISKTISYIRNKMDTALSNSSLCATIEDVQQWENSFEALLRDKVGLGLFRQFSKKEFCDENLDFWCDCEEFKKMKDGKKATTQKAHDIYKIYISEQAPKQVNIDSDTRAATKAALESGCRTDTFNLAQAQVEHLMKTHSYKRFLKDQVYLDFVAQVEEAQRRPQLPEKQPTEASA